MHFYFPLSLPLSPPQRWPIPNLNQFTDAELIVFSSAKAANPTRQIVYNINELLISCLTYELTKMPCTYPTKDYVLPHNIRFLIA